MVTVILSKAVICFAAQCFPILYGRDTRPGIYTLQQRLTASEGYGGDVLQYDETDTEVYAIHRVWTLHPNEHRQDRLRSSNPKDRVITRGCINVDASVYERLVSCCSRDGLRIVR